jgi:hypothetical protein
MPHVQGWKMKMDAKMGEKKNVWKDKMDEK